MPLELHAPKFTLEDILRIVRGIRNGIYYGGKVRFMHSFVMAMIFMKGSLVQRMRKVLKLTAEHAIKLGVYVGIFKAILVFLQKVFNRKSRLFNFISGFVGGYIVYRDSQSSINQQIILYLLSRNLIGGSKNLQDKGFFPKIKFFSFLACLSWGLVMMLYEDNKTNLQRSLATSMDFLYTDSEQMRDWTDFVPVYISPYYKAAIERMWTPAAGSSSGLL